MATSSAMAKQENNPFQSYSTANSYLAEVAVAPMCYLPARMKVPKPTSTGEGEVASIPALKILAGVSPARSRKGNRIPPIISALAWPAIVTKYYGNNIKCTDTRCSKLPSDVTVSRTLSYFSQSTLFCPWWWVSKGS